MKLTSKQEPRRKVEIFMPKSGYKNLTRIAQHNNMTLDQLATVIFEAGVAKLFQPMLPPDTENTATTTEVQDAKSDT